MKTENTALSLQDQPVGEIVLNHPETRFFFGKLGIDYCCGGKQSLSRACKGKKLDVEEVVNGLLAVLEGPSPENVEEVDFKQMPLDELVDYIVNTHHQYVQTATPEIQRLLDKVSNRHGEEHPELHEIRSRFNNVARELAMHMRKEELILFPWIKRTVMADRGEMAYQVPPFGSLANPISMMEAEHEGAGGDMERIREITNNYTLPEGACMSYWQVYELLKQFEQDLHLHVHLENNLLFPGGLALESSLTSNQSV